MRRLPTLTALLGRWTIALVRGDRRFYEMRGPDGEKIYPPLASLLAWIAGKRRRSGPRFYVIIGNRNHRRILEDAVPVLAAAGWDSRYVVVGQRVATELAGSGIHTLRWEEMIAELRCGDIVVSAHKRTNNFLPLLFHRLANVNVIAVNEGVRYAGQYRWAQHFLAWGPAAMDAFDIPVHVVGSPVIEAILGCERRLQSPPFVLVNYKFASGPQDADGRWLGSIRQACGQLGLRCAISMHPGDYNKRPELEQEVSPEEFRDLLPRAAALVTRPSATVFEAMALGIPVVVYPFGDQDSLGELAEPDGAYEIVFDSDRLALALKEAIERNDERAAARERFLARHFSIDPNRPASLRIAETLMAIADGRIPAKGA